MPTTKTALQAGSVAFRWVAAIEGYEHLLSDASQSAVIAAWTGTDFDFIGATVLQGLCVELENEQALNPWEPFTSGGRLVLKVPPDAADTFGIDTHRKNAGDETFLTATIDNNDTSISVKSTANFASSGRAYIGTECFAYTSTTSTLFNGVTRGKFSPFGVDGGTRFGHRHRFGTDFRGVELDPIVSEQPRVWIGKWVGLWMHREVAGVLDVKAQAQLVYAGRIVSIYDDPATLCTVVECKHVLDFVKDYPIGRDMWSGEIQDGLKLSRGVMARLRDTTHYASSGTPLSSANDLVVVDGPAGVNQISSGYYTLDEIYVLLNTWFTNELAAARIYGSYSIGSGEFPEGLRTYIWWNIPGGGNTVQWFLEFSKTLADSLGWRLPNHGSSVTSAPAVTLFAFGNTNNDGGGTESVAHIPSGAEEPFRYMFGASGDASLLGEFEVTNERGTFVDQYDHLPTKVINSSDDADLDWGIFVIENKYVVRGSKTGATVANLKPLYHFGLTVGSQIASDFLNKRYSEVGNYAIRQVFVYEDGIAGLIKNLLYSTGTAGYNHASYDTYGHVTSVAVPGALLGDTFEASVESLPGALASALLVIAEPTTLGTLLEGDLNLRWAFLRWKDQHLEFATWKAPTTGNSSGTLTESNKAAPSGNSDSHRSSSVLDESWQFAIVKVDYNRDITTLIDKDGGYRSSVTFEDKTAVDDSGGDPKTRTIKARNTYGELAGTGAGIEALTPNFLAILPTFSRPVRRLTRSIDSRYFEGYAVGDAVLITDEFARDPDTGARGVSIRPGIIVRHRWTPGGATPGGTTGDMGGEVDVLFMDVNRTTMYVPSAQVDDTAASSGYVAGTKTLTCYAHKYSESSEAVDASYFPAGTKYRVIEIDPENAGIPLYWDDVVFSQTGNTIVGTATLTGWDTALKYRVVFDDYADAIAGQQVYCYQADDADGMIADTRSPFRYASGQVDASAYTANAATDPVELPPNLSYGDGVGRDVGHEIAINRLANNLIDYKTARSSPFLSDAVMTTGGATMTTQFMLVEVRPIFLTCEVLTSTAGQMRNVTVAPWLRSSNGTPQSVRVTIAKTPPYSATNLDVDRGPFYDAMTFETSSTTWATGTPQTISLQNLKDGHLAPSGVVYLLIEITRLAETRGLALCQEGPRV